MAWDYRRHVVSSCLAATARAGGETTAKRPLLTTTSELAFTTRKIEASFSNFSAWHYRSKLLPKLWAERGETTNDEASRLALLDGEFNLVLQALYTDPSDQSGWLYHRWLVGRGTEVLLRREITALDELREMEPDSRYCLDAMAHYRSLLLNLLGPDHADASELRKSIVEDYRRLGTLDSTRARRYEDLERASSN